MSVLVLTRSAVDATLPSSLRLPADLAITHSEREISDERLSGVPITSGSAKWLDSRV